MIKKTLFLISIVFHCKILLAQVPCNNTVSVNCKWNSAKNCWGLAQFNGICPNYHIPYPFYSSFTDSTGFFNRPFANNCQPWKFLMYQSNCCDNPNFNWNSTCINDTSSPYPDWTVYPRMKVVDKGRLAGNDKGLEIFSYPGDHAQTSIDNCRSEASIAPEITDGDTRYYSWSFMFPSDWQDEDSASCPDYLFNHYFIMQVHPYNATAYNCNNPVPVFIFNYIYDKITNSRILKVNYGSHCNGFTPLIGTIPIVLGRWYDVMAKIKWTTDPDMSKETLSLQTYKGFTALPEIKGYGPNLYKDMADTTKIVYHKFQFGLYRGSNHCQIHHIYFDEFSMATSYEGLKSVHVDCYPLCKFDNTLQQRYATLNDNDSFWLSFDHQQNLIYLNVPDEEKNNRMKLVIYDALGRQTASYAISGSRQYELKRINDKSGVYFYAVLNEKGNRLSQGKFMLY